MAYGLPPVSERNAGTTGLFGSSAPALVAPDPGSPQPMQMAAASPPPTLPTDAQPPQPTPQIPGSSVPVGTVKNFHVFTGGDPNAKTSWQPLSGDAFLKELAKQSPAYAARVKAMGDGRLPVPGGFGGNNAPDALMMKNALAMYDPNGMDSIVNGTRAATRKNFSANGEAMQNIRNLNQAIGHLSRLADNIPNVAGAQIPLVGNLANWIGNTYESVSGDPGITSYTADQTALSNELASVFKGKGASSENEVNKFSSQLDPSASTPQKQANVREISELLNSRLQELADQYNQGMGASITPMHFLDPASQKAFARLRQLGQAQPGPGSAPPKSAPTNADPPMGAIQKLRGNPSLAALFDQKYGTGAAMKALGR